MSAFKTINNDDDDHKVCESTQWNQNTVNDITSNKRIK